MLERALNRIMRGAKTPEGKVVAVLMTFVLAFMVWDSRMMTAAFAAQDASVSASSGALKAADPAGTGESAVGENNTTAKANSAQETWTVTFYDDDADVQRTVKVAKGQAIGNKLPAAIEREGHIAHWAIGEIVQGGQGNEVKVTGARIDAGYIPTSDAVIVPDYEKVNYTVSFYESENAAAALATRTVNIDTNYCINDMPPVPAKAGYAGKWVYAGGDFDNTVAVSSNLRVWAAYEQNAFTVTYKLDSETVYETDTCYPGNTLELPADPAVEGKQFVGWFAGKTQYVGGEEVTSDLTLTAKFDELSAVNFVVLNDDGTVRETLPQYFRAEGEAIGVMPQDPFVQGKVFEKWVIQGTETQVTAETIVTGNMTIVAVFRTVDVYSVTTEYYYESATTPGKEVVFNTELLQVEAHEFPYTITAPATTQASPDEVSDAPIYYPETPTVTLTADDFDSARAKTIRFKYVPRTAAYDFVYKVKDLTGDGYTEFDRESTNGVLHSYVTPVAKTYDHYVLEQAHGAEITQAEGQELEVTYTRKNYMLSYDSAGGSYVGGGTYAYGSAVALSSTTPTREGYDFAGWYSDAALTQQVVGSVTIEGNTTLYAKWNPKTVGYTIVYMLEEYASQTGTTSYVYDNSRTASGQVGTTVYASSAPDLTGSKYRGYERDAAWDEASSVVVAADGSSVLMVHYKLIRYTLVFDTNRDDGRITMGGETYTGSNYRVENVVLGQNVGSMWPASQSEIYDLYSNSYFDGWTGASATYITKRYELLYDNVANADSNHVMTFTARWSSDSVNRDAQYWLQQPDGSYQKADEYTQVGLNTTSLGAKDIAGYSKHNDVPAGYPRSGYYDDDDNWLGDGGKYTYRFYYDRDQYQIDYYFGDTKLSTKSDVFFEASINNSTYNYEPEKPASTSAIDYGDYAWGGWYADPALQTPYVFDKMPGRNVALYAKWIAPELTVAFEMDGGTPAVQPQTISKHERATKPENPVKPGYTFDGWHTTPDGDSLFEWTTRITADTTLYAHWTKNALGYTVHYVDEGGKQLAADKVVANPHYDVGQSIAESAIVIAGYRPLEGSQTIVLGETSNEITFAYSAKVAATDYTVRYILDPAEFGGDIEVAAPKTVENVPGDTASVVELAATVDYDALYAAHPELQGYELHSDAAEKTLVLSANKDSNVLTFYYSSFKSAQVKVHFADMDGEEIATTDTQIVKVGKTFTLRRTSMTGWELNKAVVGTSYDGDEAGVSYKITEADVSAGLEFTLYYQKKATIAVAGNSKQYDGEALTLPSAVADQVIVEGLKQGDTLTGVDFEYANTDTQSDETPGRINVGVATVTPKDAVIVAHAHPHYYKVRYISGTLEVTKVNVSVRVEPDRWTGNVYDGAYKQAGFTNGSKTLEDYILISHDGYREKHLYDIWNAITVLDNVVYDKDASGLKYYIEREKDAGEYEYALDLSTADLPESDNYSVSLYVRAGRLQIVPKDVTVKADDKTKVYDNDESTDPALSATVVGAVEGDTVNYTLAREEGQDAGDYAITATAGENPNYQVAVESGTFTITPAPMTITLNGSSDTRVYNGGNQTFEGDVTPSCESALFDASKFSYAGVTAVPGKDAGEYTEAIDIAKASYADPNIDAAFVAGEPIKLSIAKAALTVTADGASKIYGASDPELDYTVSGLKGSDTKGVLAGVTVTRAPGEGVGSYAITATGPESIKNYVVDYEGGSFKVVAAPFPANPDDSDSRFTVTEPEDVVYNGRPQRQPIALTDKTTGDALVEGEDYELVYSDDITNAGTVTVTVKGIGSYEGSFDVSYEIAPAQLVVTTPDASKTYDGSALISEGEITGFVNNETATFATTGSQTNAGKSDNTYSLTWDGTAKESNYTLSEKIGTLEVAPRDVTLTSASASKAFDGTPLVRNAQADVAVAGDGFVEGEGATYAITGTQTQVGESDNAFTYELTESTLAQNYNIDTVFGRLAVTEEAPEPPTPTPTEHNPHLTVVKSITSQPANGDAYEEGEVIAYSVTVSNDGDVDLIDVVVSDQLKGFAWDEGVNPQIGSLAVNESVTLTGSYRVTKGDAEAGSVSNTARATGIFKESGGSNLEADPSGHEAPASSGKGDSGSGVSPSGTHTPGGPGAAAPSAPAPGATGATGTPGATSTVSVVPAAGSSAPATSTSGTPAVATSGTGTSSLPTESVEALQDTGNPLVENAGGANPLDPNRGAGWVFGLLCAITAALLAIAALVGALITVFRRRRVDDAPAAEGAYIR